MARDVGTATFPGGVGVKTLNLGLPVKDMALIFKGPNILPAEYHIANGYQYGFSDNSSIAGTTLRVKNLSGTVILEGTWTSFTGNNAIFNITTQTGTVPQMLVDLGY